MTNMSIPTTFSVDFFGELEKVNDLVSKVSARIYYKGGNRNGTWITDEFAEKLNKTFPYVPIVASYNSETGDFEDHQDKGKKKAYGVVPGNPNVQWVLGDDGKEYATVDVYLWTGYWEEASKLINKSQSMELEKSTIVGDWKVVGGDYYFVYQAGALKGLCGLGDVVTPCFENSAFFNLNDKDREFFQDLAKNTEETLRGGNVNMTKQLEIIPATEMSAVEIVETPIVETTSEVTVVSAEGAEFETATEIEETTVIVVEEPAEEFIEGGPEEGGAGDGESASEKIVERDSLEIVERHSEVSANSDGSMTSISTTTVQMIDIETYYALQKENEELKAKVFALETENANLEVYKVNAISQEKAAIVEQFKKRLSDEEISEFVEAIENYTTDELKTKLSVVLADKMLREVTEAKPQSQYVAVPATGRKSGVAAILEQHKNKQ